MAENEITKEKSRKVKLIRLVFFVMLVFFISGISSIFFGRYVFPWLATQEWFKKKAFFKKATDNVTVINKTEQITVSESQDIFGYTQKSASSVVEIVVRQKGHKDIVFASEQSVSGTVVTSDGLVASFGDKFFSGKDAEYRVYFSDGKSYSAQIAAVDPFSSIVLLKLDKAENLPVAEFIAPEDIKIGIKAAVIGRSGFNAETSLLLGIASEWAKSYSLAGPLASSEKLQGVLFADFSRSVGADSKSLTGGAVVDQNGNMLGILGEAKEGSDTKMFIVPVNHLKYVVDQYLGKGKIERVVLGVYYIALSKENAYLVDNSFERGALVYSPSGQQGLAVIMGSAADKAGIKIGDIVLSVNGEEVNPDQNLAQLISKYKPGDKIELKVVRDGKEMLVQAILG